MAEATTAPNPEPQGSAPEDVTARLSRLEAENRKLREESAERRVAAKRLEDEKATAQRRIEELEPYQQTVAQEVANLKAELGERAKVVDGLSEARALRILKEMKALAGGPGAARPTTAGQPAPPRSQPELNALNPIERREYLRSLPHEELVRLNGGHRGVSPLVHTLKR